MFKIHKKVKYALIALKYMSGRKAGLLTTAKEVCNKYEIPFDPTSRVLQLMAQKGLLKAEQGAKGGYRLMADLSKVSIYELSRIVVGEVSVSDCASEKGGCHRSVHCVLKGAMAKLNSKVVGAFKDVMVSEMV